MNDDHGTHQGALPKSDPAYPIVEAILKVVPASHWAFARIDRDGELEALLASGGDGVPSTRENLEGEYKLQREQVKSGARIAAALGNMLDYESGITLLFADARSNFGVLTIVRTAQYGPFTSSEIGMLTLALAATSDRLSSLRLHLNEDTAREGSHTLPGLRRDPPDGSFYVLDRDLQIVLAWSAEEQRRVALTGLHTRVADRLPAVLEETVRDLTASWNPDASLLGAGVARPVPFLVVRTDPITGPAGLFIGVHIDRFQPANSLTNASEKFHITPREVQVLALLLDGEHLDEIGKRLHITSSTVQDHIRSMVEKTGSRNRSDLIARILGWEFAPSGR